MDLITPWPVQGTHLTWIQERCSPDTGLFGELHMIEDICVDQTVPSILKADRQVHRHYIHPLPFVVPNSVPVCENIEYPLYISVYKYIC